MHKLYSHAIYVLFTDIYALDACPWSTSLKEDDTLLCWDGYYCNINVDADGWACCNKHGGRAKCPSNYPVMCAKKNCSANKSDYCCQERGVCDKGYNGVRPCKEKGNYQFVYPKKICILVL